VASSSQHPVHQSQMASMHAFLAAANPRGRQQQQQQQHRAMPPDAAAAAGSAAAASEGQEQDEMEQIPTSRKLRRFDSQPNMGTPMTSQDSCQRLLDDGDDENNPHAPGGGGEQSKLEAENQLAQSVLINGSPAVGALDLWVGHSVTSFGETTSPRVTLQSRVVAADGAVLQQPAPPAANPNIGDRTAHLHNYHHRGRHQNAVAAVISNPSNALAGGAGGGFKEEWLEEGKAVPLVTTVEAERISSLPRLPRRKQNTNVGVGNGSRAFRTMMKAMREALQNEQIQKQLERDGGSAAGAGGAAVGAGVGGKETHDIAVIPNKIITIEYM